jgi:hypothetical protein
MNRIGTSKYAGDRRKYRAKGLQSAITYSNRDTHVCWNARQTGIFPVLLPVNSVNQSDPSEVAVSGLAAVLPRENRSGSRYGTSAPG